MPIFYGEKLDSSRNILGMAFLFSLLIHLLFFSTFPSHFRASDTLKNPFNNEKIIRVKRIPPVKDGQVVDVIDDKSIVKDDVDSDYLSDKNRKVTKQTRAIELAQPVPQQQPQSQSTPLEKKSKYNLDLSDKAIQKLAEKNGPVIMNQSASNYLPEITIGNETLLDTKQFAFSSFYVRMKREVSGFWNPQRVINTNRTVRGQYITTIFMVLDENGDLVHDQIVRSSGIAGFDQEAQQAIEKASPFPNPPKEIMDENKEIRLNFTFIVDSSSIM